MLRAHVAAVPLQPAAPPPPHNEVRQDDQPHHRLAQAVEYLAGEGGGAGARAHGGGSWGRHACGGGTHPARPMPAAAPGAAARQHGPHLRQRHAAAAPLAKAGAHEVRIRVGAGTVALPVKRRGSAVGGAGRGDSDDGRAALQPAARGMHLMPAPARRQPLKQPLPGEDVVGGYAQAGLHQHCTHCHTHAQRAHHHGHGHCGE